MFVVAVPQRIRATSALHSLPSGAGAIAPCRKTTRGLRLPSLRRANAQIVVFDDWQIFDLRETMGLTPRLEARGFAYACGIPSGTTGDFSSRVRRRALFEIEKQRSNW